MTTLNRKIIQMRWDLRKFKNRLKARILTLPDNPKITRLGGGAFTISSADILYNLSPDYYDFKHQYEFLCDIIDRTDTMELPKKLKVITTTGKSIYTIQSRHGIVKNKFVFHPDVINAIKQTLDESI